MQSATFYFIVAGLISLCIPAQAEELMHHPVALKYRKIGAEGIQPAWMSFKFPAVDTPMIVFEQPPSGKPPQVPTGFGLDLLGEDTAAAKLYALGASAIPFLIDAALDKKSSPRKRAWVLGMLFGITGHNDPRQWNGFLGNPFIIGQHEYKTSVVGGISGGMIDVKQQRKFAEQWRVWKNRGYYKVVR